MGIRVAIGQCATFTNGWNHGEEMESCSVELMKLYRVATSLQQQWTGEDLLWMGRASHNCFEGEWKTYVVDSFWLLLQLCWSLEHITSWAGRVHAVGYRDAGALALLVRG